MVALALGVTRNGFRLNSVPDPFNGTNVCMKPDMRRILRLPGVGAGPGRMFELIVQSVLVVSPARTTAGPFVPLVTKPMTAES